MTKGGPLGSDVMGRRFWFWVELGWVPTTRNSSGLGWVPITQKSPITQGFSSGSGSNAKKFLTKNTLFFEMYTHFSLTMYICMYSNRLPFPRFASHHSAAEILDRSQ